MLTHVECQTAWIRMKRRVILGVSSGSKLVAHGTKIAINRQRVKLCDAGLIKQCRHDLETIISVHVYDV